MIKLMNSNLASRSVPGLRAADLLLAGLWLGTAHLGAVNFAGNGSSAWGGAVGNGTLSVTDDGNNLTFTLTKGGGTLDNPLVIYIDSKTGGFADTAGFTDTGDSARKAISGFDGGNRSVMTFTNGFLPDYAITIEGGYASLFTLVNGGAFTWQTGASQSGNSSATFTLTVGAAQIGLAPGVNATIRLFGTYISGTGYRSPEAIAGNDFSLFGAGWNPWTQTAYSSYNFDAGAPVPHPVTFQVDMTVPIASGSFDTNGGTVYASGSFEDVPGTGFLLTQGAPPNDKIYSGTYQDYNPTNTAEHYNYYYVSANTVRETVDARPFTVQTSSLTLPVVYFNDLAPAADVPTHALTFQIDMTPQIALGHFTPGNDSIEARGTFQTPVQWTGGFQLTNNPTLSGNASNLYTGTYPDGNYPGTYEQYKFVIVGAATSYEDGNNRTFVTPSGDQTFPVAYFNNITSAYNIPVTFQVDMTVPILLGTFNPGAGDTCGAAGTFQTNQWTAGAAGFQLTPGVGNTNIYTGTYIVKYPPGSGQQYKFVINTNGGGTAYESIANRAYVQGATAQTLPLVSWNNVNGSDLLLADTLVFFSINMNGAVGTDGHVFNPAADRVYINGQFANWYHWANMADPADATPYELIDPAGTGIYSNTIVIPKGTTVAFNYKYGLGIDGSPYASDDEAPSGNDHFRAVRSTALKPYRMPQDTWGNPYREPFFSKDNPAGANLLTSAAAAGKTAVSWLGRPGAHLQSKASLSTGSWQDHWETDGTNWTAGVSSTNGLVSVTNWPAGGIRFFRLVKP